MNTASQRSATSGLTGAIRRWGWLVVALAAWAVRADEGVALGIVLDTSGSMAGSVRDRNGGQSPKYLAADRVLRETIDRLENYASNAPAGAGRRVQVGLYAFDFGQAKVAVPCGDFDGAALRQWVKKLRPPRGPTPLGETLLLAGGEVLKSRLPRKHVLVVTDGVNTRGPEPAVVLTRLREEANRRGTDLRVHFVAFDVSAKAFTAVKRQGASVVGASDEAQLRAQMREIVEESVLLEQPDRK